MRLTRVLSLATDIVPRTHKEALAMTRLAEQSTRTAAMKPNRVDAAIVAIGKGWETHLSADERNAARRWMATYAHVNPDADAVDIAIAGLGRIHIVGRCSAAARTALTIPDAAWSNAHV
ncbi:hypothetical protein Kuura_054 [Caulobacter phage Kuura]|nr:hypothetical protein Kuura_054 [Caulobacter phage Kuura]